MAKRVLITGGAGFIGSHVSQQFTSAGWKVSIIDDLSSGKKENVPQGATLHHHDLRSKEAFDAVVSDKPQVICHLAAQIDVRKSMADPRYDCDVNLGGLLNLMQAAVKAGSVEQVVFASSGGAMYGETDLVPTKEDHVWQPVSHYGVAKASSELYLGVYRANFKIRCAAMRFANVYGTRQDPLGEAGVVAIFADRLLAGKGATIYGDGTQTRDFVYAGDVARSLVLAAEKGYDGAVNIGTGIETDVNQLYEIMARVVGSEIEPTHGPGRAGEQRRSAIDPAKALRDLGWKPEVPLGNGLASTIEWFRARRR